MEMIISLSNKYEQLVDEWIDKHLNGCSIHYVGATAASGKSTLAKLLTSRGIAAFDADFARVPDIEPVLRVARNIGVEFQFGWTVHNNYWFMMKLAGLFSILRVGLKHVIFLDHGFTALNDFRSLQKLTTHVSCIIVPEDELKRRLKERNPDMYEEHLPLVLSNIKSLERSRLAFEEKFNRKVNIIDGMQTPEQIANRLTLYSLGFSPEEMS